MAPTCRRRRSCEAAPERLRPPRIGGRRRCLQPMSRFATQRQTPARRAAKARSPPTPRPRPVLRLRGTSCRGENSARARRWRPLPYAASSSIFPRSMPSSGGRSPRCSYSVVRPTPERPGDLRHGHVAALAHGQRRRAVLRGEFHRTADEPPGGPGDLPASLGALSDELALVIPREVVVMSRRSRRRRDDAVTHGDDNTSRQPNRRWSCDLCERL